MTQSTRTVFSMSIGFRTNISAMRATRLNDATQRRLGDSYAQLSSGQRISRPGTDPAGNSVALKLRADVRVSQRARLNIDDGISYLQTADGTLESSGQVAQRMVELAEQAANGSFSSSQRASLQKEFNELRSELLRLRDATSFNGVQVSRGAPVARDPQLLGPLSGGSAISELSISADGRYVTYAQSNSLKQRDTLTGEIRTIASSIGGVSSSDLGDKVAYTSAAGTTLYVWDRSTNTTSQLLSGTVVGGPTISGDGSRVAFISPTVYSSSGVEIVADGNDHPATISVATGSISGDGGNYGISGSFGSLDISFDGSRTVMLADLASGADGFLFDSTDMSVARATTGTGNVSFAGVGADGRMYLVSNANLGGTNPGAAYYIFSTADGANYSKVLQVDSSIGSFSMTDNGNSISFSSTGNIASNGTNGVYQLYKSTLAGNVQRLTNYASSTAANVAVLSGDGYSGLIFSASKWYSVDYRPESSLSIDTGNGSSGALSVGVLASDGAIRGLHSMSLTTQSLARASLDSLKASIGQLNLARSSVGAGLSRLQSASRTTEARAVTLQSALGQITDVDVAQALAENARLQILSQTQVSILAQTSSMIPQIALNLLQG